MRESHGTVRCRESGRWQFQFTVAEDGGRRHHSKGGFASEEEARRALAVAISDHQRGVRTPRRRQVPTLEDFIRTEWLPALGHLKSSTVTNYEWVAEVCIIPTLGQQRLTEITGSQVAKLFSKLRSQGGRTGVGLAESTVHKASVVLTSVYSHAVELGVTPSSPMSAVPSRSRPKSGSRNHRFAVWSESECRLFLERTATDPMGVVWRVFLATGMRRGEVAGLRWSDVDLDRLTLTVVRNRTLVGGSVVEGSPKAGRGRRVTIDSDTAASLRRLRVEQARRQLAAGSTPGWSYVALDRLGQPLRPDFITKAFRLAVRDAKLPSLRLHDLRHTHATLLLSRGQAAKTVQERLGHASIQTTLDLYGHVTAELEQAAADTIGAALTSGQSA